MGPPRGRARQHGPSAPPVSTASLARRRPERSMHIPDGYLSPIVSIGLGAATVPAWGIASQKIKAILNNRTIPLLAIFAALSFTIMMFNIPVPGGTTAHGVCLLYTSPSPRD